MTKIFDRDQQFSFDNNNRKTNQNNKQNFKQNDRAKSRFDYY